MCLADIHILRDRHRNKGGPNLATTRHGAEKPLRDAHIEWANRAILFVDIVEFVRLIEMDEVGIVSRWLRFVDHVRTSILQDCGGRLVKNLGDGLLMEFSNVRGAASAAFAIQHACNRGNAGIAAEQQILLRMGIEIGDVMVEGDDVYGHEVNLASRLMGLAGPGEIITTANARSQLTAVLDADVEDLGECFLRHISNPVRAYRIGPPGPRPVIQPGGNLGELTATIAVVPFAPRRAEDEHPVAGEIFAEEIIRALSHAPDLNVISRLSTTAFSGRQLVLDEINAHLSANYLLSGQYSTSQRNIVLDLELAEAKSGQVVWMNRLDGPVSDILSGEQELVASVVAEVGIALMSRELQRSQSLPLPTLKSYTLLLAAISLMHRLSLRDFEQARHLLQTLIDRRSRQAVPQAWLAKWHVLRVQQGWSVDQQHDSYLASECAKRALDADPNCSLALAMDGIVHTNLLKKLDIAQERYELAIETNPNDALAWLLKGTLHAFKGEGQQGVADTQRALKLTPLDPHRYFYDSLAATACLAAHRYEDAHKLAQRSLRANRTHTSTLRVMAAAQWHLGFHDEARKTAQDLLKLEPNLTVSGWLARSPSAPYVTGKEWSKVLRQVGVPS